MPTPLLIDTDMGIDDAVAVTLALSSDQIALVGMASVGGNVPLAQATLNMSRLLSALRPPHVPPLAEGLDRETPELLRAHHVFGHDGFGELELDASMTGTPGSYVELYERALREHEGKLVILAIGPLTNLAALLRDRPGLLEKAARIIIMGGAVWCMGNVTPQAEFNFYRDPESAAAVLSSGLPITVVPLDVTRQVAMDDSHEAELARSGTRSGELLARMLRFPMERKADGLGGRFLVHDALALGVLLWPELFMQSKMALQIVTTGKEAGRSKPAMARDKQHKQLGVVISVNVDDFLENLIEQLCHQKFVV
jgi:purine nucleosidase